MVWSLRYITYGKKKTTAYFFKTNFSSGCDSLAVGLSSPTLSIFHITGCSPQPSISRSSSPLLLHLTFIIPTSFIHIQSAATLCVTGTETNEQTNECFASCQWHFLRRVEETLPGKRKCLGAVWCLLFGSSYCAIYLCFFTVVMAAAWSHEAIFIRHLLLEILLFAWEPSCFQFILCDVVMQFFFLLKWL